MRHRFVPATASAGMLSLLVLAAAPARTSAQRTANPDFRDGMRTGIGYTAIIPDALVGFGAFRFLSSGLGAFVDGKLTVPSITRDAQYCPPEIRICSVSWVEAERNDQLIRDEVDWLLLNAGVMVTLSPELALMLGAGPARKRRFREYFDEDVDPITDTGSYFVDGEPKTEWIANIGVGGLFRAGRRLAFRVGYESAPGGASLGAYLVLGK